MFFGATGDTFNLRKLRWRGTILFRLWEDTWHFAFHLLLQREKKTTTEMNIIFGASVNLARSIVGQLSFDPRSLWFFNNTFDSLDVFWSAMHLDWFDCQSGSPGLQSIHWIYFKIFVQGFHWLCLWLPTFWTSFSTVVWLGLATCWRRTSERNLSVGSLHALSSVSRGFTKSWVG